MVVNNFIQIKESNIFGFTYNTRRRLYLLGILSRKFMVNEEYPMSRLKVILQKSTVFEVHIKNKIYRG